MSKNGNKFSEARRDFFKTLGAGMGTAALLPGLGAASDAGEYPDLAKLRRAHLEKGTIPALKTYRMMEWEFHTPPQESFDHLNIPAALDASRHAGTEAQMFYTQDHWGYAYYSTKVAVPHPHLHYDLFGLEAAEARKRNIAVATYYCLQFNNQIVLNHPDWGWVNEKGEPEMFRWYVTCLDTPYRQYVLGMMNEIFSKYEVDELFLDIFGIQFVVYHSSGRNPFCFCKYTEDAWNREHPGDPYREGFKTREGWERRYRWHQKRTMTDMLDEIIKIARGHRPNLKISLNGGPESFPDDIMQKVSFIYAEPLPCRTGISLGSILMRGWDRPYYQAGVFTRQGYIDMYPGAIPRVQAGALIVQNSRTFFVGDAPIINGLDGQGFSKRWFAVADETWQDVRNVDCLLGPEIQPVLSTAMLYSASTREEMDAEKRPVDFRQSTLGALETLTYSGRPVESLPEFRLTPETLAGFETLVLPEVEVLSEAHAQVIRDWVKQGGTLISSYKCGLLDEKRQPRRNFPLADVFGVDYVSEERKYAYDAEGKLREGDFTSTYIESAGHPLAKMLAVSTVGLPGSFLRLKTTTAAEVMRYRLPFMVQNMKKNEWFNWGPPPPGAETAGTAAAYNKFGKGQSLYMGVPIFWAMQYRLYWIQDWIPALMRQLAPDPIAELRPEPFSEYVHGTFFYDASKRFILVQVLNTVELATEGEFRPAPKVVLRINPKKLNVTGARVVWPKERDLRVTAQGGKTEIILENPGRYTALFLKLA